MTRQRILAEITQERDHQDILWGGPLHDDQHTSSDWIAILTRHLGLACGDSAEVDPERYRRQLIRVAATAVAAVEALDRQMGREPTAGAVHTGKGW